MSARDEKYQQALAWREAALAHALRFRRGPIGGTCSFPVVVQLRRGWWPFAATYELRVHAAVWDLRAWRDAFAPHNFHCGIKVRVVRMNEWTVEKCETQWRGHSVICM